MNLPTGYPPPPSARPSSALAWLLTTIAIGLSVFSAALVFALDIQRTELQQRQTQLLRSCALREAENKRLLASSATAEAELKRLTETYADEKSDFARLAEARSKREPLVQKSLDVQVKLQSLVEDLVNLAKTDSDALAISTKYNIHQDTPPPRGDDSPAK